MDHIDQHLATTALNADYPMAIKAALAIGKTTLNRYYNKTEHSEILQWVWFIKHLNTPSQFLILVLHPQHKLEYFKKARWEEDWVTKAEEIVHTEFACSYKYSEIFNGDGD